MDERVHHLGARFPAAKVHLYGKSFAAGRKLGHVNVGGSDLAEVRRVAQLAGALPLLRGLGRRLHAAAARARRRRRP